MKKLQATGFSALALAISQTAVGIPPEEATENALEWKRKADAEIIAQQRKADALALAVRPDDRSAA